MGCVDVLQPDACRTNFDAVSMIRGELFFFKSQYVWRIRHGHLQGGYPALSSRHWRGIPDYIDAAYEDKSGNIWFFQGKKGNLMPKVSQVDAGHMCIYMYIVSYLFLLKDSGRVRWPALQLSRLVYTFGLTWGSATHGSLALP